MVRRVSVAAVSGPAAGLGRWPWLDRWISEFGRPVEPGRVRIAASQAQLARAEGISPGTVNERVRRLSDAGVLISREPLVIAMDDPTPTANVGGGVAEGFDLAERVLTFMRQHGVTPEGQAFLVQVIDTLDDAAAAARPVPRLRGLPTAEGPRLSADSEDRTIQSPLLLPVQDLQTAEPRGPRDGRATPRGTGDTTEPAWLAAVGALTAAAVERGLPAGPRYPERLWEVASSVSAAERLAAIGRVTDQVRGGDPIKDPFGLLYSVIEARQPEYLHPVPATSATLSTTSRGSVGGGAAADGRDIRPEQMQRPLVSEIERCDQCGKLALPGNCTCGVPLWRPPTLAGALPVRDGSDVEVVPVGSVG